MSKKSTYAFRRTQAALSSKLQPSVLTVVTHLALIGGLGALQPAVQAQTATDAQQVSAARTWSIPAGSLDAVLARFVTESGVPLAATPELVQDKQSRGLNGRYTIAEGFAALLAEHGLQAVPQGNGSYTLQRVQAPQQPIGANTANALPEVVVRASATGLPPAYAGGQVATGGRVGLLGNKDILETPFSTVSYTQEHILNSQSQDVMGVIGKTDPSVFTSGTHNMQTLGTASGTYNFRGFGTDASIISFDGLFGVTQFNRGLLEIAERVEVIKGPTALINGMPPGGAIGGSINLVPKRAGQEPLYRLTGTYVSNGQFGARIDAGKRFGENKQLGIRVNGVYSDGDTEVHKQKKRDELYALAIDWRSERVRLSADLFSGKYLQRGVDYGINIGSVTQVPSPPDPRRLLSHHSTFIDSKEQGVVLKAEADLSRNITVHAIASDSTSKYDALSGFTGTLLNAQGDFLANAAHQRSIFKKKSADVGLRASFDTAGIGHELAISTNYHSSDRQAGFRIRLFGDGYISNLYSPVTEAAPDASYSHAAVPKSNETRLKSFAIADTLSFMDGRLQLTLGLRHQNIRSDTFNPATGQRAARYDKSAISPAAAVVYRVNNGLSIYANNVQGLSQGSVAPASAANAGEVFAPFKTKQYELGLKAEHDGFGYIVSAFQIERPQTHINPISNVFSYGGQQRNRGLEFSFFGEASQNLRLLGGVSYTQAKITESAIAESQGRIAIAAPRWQAKLGAEWDVPGIDGLTLTGNAVMVSKQYVNASNTLHVPSRTLYDLGVRYKQQVAGYPVVLRASVLNLGDKVYWASGRLYEGAGAPRTYMLSATVDF